MRTVFDLFAGCGGLSTGLEMAGFKPLLVSELSPDAMSSYLANRHHTVGTMLFADQSDLHFHDVYSLDKKAMLGVKKKLTRLGLLEDEGTGSSLDLICGGPPCQGYSGIGHRRNYAVEKKDIPSNQLYEQMATIIEYFRPKVFLFENVKGLLTAKWTTNSQKGDIWRNVRDRFDRIRGYEVRWSLIHAKDYGVPQNRPRVLLVGIREDILASCCRLDAGADPEDALLCGFIPDPTGTPPSIEDILSDLVSPEYPEQLVTNTYPSAPRTAIQRQLRTRPDGKVMGKHAQLEEQVYSKHSPQIREKFSYMLKHQGEIKAAHKTKKFAQRVLPRQWGEKGPMNTVTSLPDDYVHYAQPRTLTVRECARLQLFPDWYVFHGTRTTGGIRRSGNPRKGIFERDTPKYTQIGNAVPVGLAQHLGEHFGKILG